MLQRPPSWSRARSVFCEQKRTLDNDFRGCCSLSLATGNIYISRGCQYARQGAYFFILGRTQQSNAFCLGVGGSKHPDSEVAPASVGAIAQNRSLLFVQLILLFFLQKKFNFTTKQILCHVADDGAGRTSGGFFHSASWVRCGGTTLRKHGLTFIYSDLFAVVFGIEL